MIKTKKGFLLAEETLKMILAVIAIGFLAFLLFSLYNSGKESRDLQFATESLDFLMGEIERENGNVEILNPKGWVIISWPHEEIKPNSCSNLGWEKCICISKDVSLGSQILSSLPFTESVIQKFSDNSDEGVCRENEEGFIVKKEGNITQPIVIENPPVKLSIDYENKIISEDN
ncbi:MAG: hypothetical protein WDZ62_01020 [Candidatus Pacearchaeota archaeon]